jgi:NAD(P)-dependent dehydrogenase (short-subunit alcohol dehydrogenase family)
MKIKLPDELDFIRVGRLPQKSSQERAEGKIVMITGATSGIGYVTSWHFAKHGAQLIFLVRNKEKGILLSEKLQLEYGTKCTVYVADFENLKQVDSVLSEITGKQDRIDILINNAGAHRTRKKILSSGIDAIYTVNHLSSFLVTKKLLGLLEKSKDPRIINVNSEGHRFGKTDLDDLGWNKRMYTGLRSYGQSKTAQLHCMYIWAKKLKSKNITINSMHPGAVKSNIGSHSGKLYNFYLKYFIGPTLRDPKISANALYYLAISEDMSGTTGQFYNLTNFEKPAPYAQESENSMTIFEHTEALIANEIL